MQTNPSIKSKLVLAYGWQGGERRKELPRKDKYVYYLVCGDGHEYMYMSKCIELYAFKYMQYIVDLCDVVIRYINCQDVWFRCYRTVF